MDEIWVDHKGRHIQIHTMSYRWLNNIVKKYRNTEKVKPFIAELKRRQHLKIK